MSSLLQYTRLNVRESNPEEAQRRNAEALNYLLRVCNVFADILRTVSVLSGASGMSVFATTVDIKPYDNAIPISGDNSIEEDATLGTITIGEDGWYMVSGYYVCTGSNNSAYYGVRIDIAGTDFYVGALQWDNNNPGMVFNGSIRMSLSAGDVIKAEAYCSTGTLTVLQANLSAKMELPL